MSRSAPLLELTSIRTRLAVLVGVSVVVAAVVGTVGTDAGVPLWIGLPATIGLALVVTRWLATGMTTPLIQMTDAARRMAKGDYGARITTSSQDEVGELARAFASMAAELEQGEEHRRRLVATVAHELRTPLSAQQALLENLADGVTTPDETTLRAALAQSERLGCLVTDLLDLSRPDSRRIPLSPSRIRVGELLDDAIAEASLQGRDLTLVVDVEPSDLTITGDRDRLAQVTANLLDNAVRHSPSGGTVTLTARTTDDAWTLTVADEGPGLTPERAERLFHRFGPGGDEGGGTGLGLAIAAWVASMHGGTIRALDADAGARLELHLPLTPPTSPSPAPLTTTTTQEPTMTAESAPSLRGSAANGLAPQGTGLSLSRWWPERVTQGQPWLLLAALAVGLLAAILLPGNAIGLGLLVVLTAGGAALWLASPRRAKPWSWVTAALALPLGLTTILRDDPVMSFFAVAVAGVLAAAACTDARTVTGMIASVIAWPLSALRGLPLLDRTIRVLARRGSAWSVLRSGVVSLALLLVFGGLLASADAVLGSWAAGLVPDISDMAIFRVFVLVFFAGVTLAGLYLAINPPTVDGAELSPRIPEREWQVPLGVVIAIFVAFVVAQAAAVVGGHDYVMRTAGVTYAESARQGFGQLTLATALVLLLVAGVRALGRTSTERDRRVMRAMNAALCVLTLLVVASALRRMALYQEAYGYTTLRINGDLFEVWLGLVVLAVLVSLFTPTRRWLGRTVLVTAAALTIVGTVGNTSAWVADRNIERWQATGKIDTWYLSSLPADAVPTIESSALPAHIKQCALSMHQVYGAGDEDTLAGWNLARSRAEEIRQRYDDPTQCTDSRGWSR
ncbi:hypothetical protein ASJ30_11455 [Janibacter indicus]|uniref:Signal transduction histidine-protein kinase/phosphatase MprB n=1 Tax=Janibacter indicus TaxID=857417 RepID=A0A1L3MIR6_9MICO|nr:DUF4153 domain-containing protein [Janibacter indicus]APH02064.1 hypothetical protein ASJ30_11455 [Janibacter indicus]